MNKYQEALDRLENFAYHGGEKGDNTKIIQELVDKETPRKVLIVNDEYACPTCMNGNRLSTYERECYPHYDNPRCGECGQALDWSENE